MLSRTNLASFSLCSTPNPRVFMRLQPLDRSQKSQLLCNQANPASFAKMPGVWGGHPERNYGTPGVGCAPKYRPRRINNLQTLLALDLYALVNAPDPLPISSRHSFTQSIVCEGPLPLHGVASHPQLSTVDYEPLFPPSPTTFRINTCKSVSKQTTLTSFRINTYEKKGGGGYRRS